MSQAQIIDDLETELELAQADRDLRDAIAFADDLAGQLADARAALHSERDDDQRWQQLADDVDHLQDRLAEARDDIDACLERGAVRDRRLRPIWELRALIAAARQ